MPSTHEYDFRAASSDEDFRQIVALQALNRPEILDPAELASQGFVTLRHTVELLREMNEPWPHVVATARATGEVVAYALMMQAKFRDRFPALEPMFQRLEGLQHRGRPIESLRWYVMGQICVAREHRGRGLVEGMYAEHRRLMARDFDVVITEINRTNPRSVRAHLRAGFEVLLEFTGEDGVEWVVVALDLKS